MTTLNAAFESKFTSEDKGYESGSENFNIPDPLPKTSRIHQVSSIKMPPLTQFQVHHTVPEIHDSDLYAEGWHSATLMMMAL